MKESTHEKTEPQSEKDAELVSEAHELFQRSADVWADNRRWFVEDLDFVSGKQWPDSIQRDRDAQDRPCITVNRMPQFIRQVTNDQRQNRPSIKVRAVDDYADPETADIMQGLIRHIEANSNADLAYDNGTFYAVAGGFGFWRVHTDYVPKQFEQEIYISAIENSLTVYPDADDMSLDGSKWKYCFIAEEMPRKEFEAKYGKDAPEGWDAGDGLEESGWCSKDAVRVCEYWRIELKDDELVKLSDDQVMYLSEYEKAEEPAPIVNRRPCERPAVKWYLLAGSKILDRKDWAGKYIPIVPVFGEQLIINGKRVLRSLIRDGKDQQRMINYYRSTEAEVCALQPKQAFIAAEGQLEGYEDMWADANNINYSTLVYKPTTIAGVPVPPPQRSQPMGLHQGAMAMSEMAAADLMDVIGIHQAGLGMKSNESSGRAILARQREGDTGTFHFIDNCVRAIRYTGMILVDLIPKIYDTQRVVRILGEDGKEKTITVNEEVPDDETNEIDKIYDLGLGTYDVVCSAGASYTTRRQEASEAMMQILPQAPQLMQVAGDLIVKAMDWPGAEEIAKRLEGTLPPELRPKDDKEGEQAPPPELMQAQEQMKQMDEVIQKMQAELDDKQGKEQAEMQKAANEAAKIEVDRFKAETDRFKAESEAAIKANSDLTDSEKVQFHADMQKLLEDMKQDHEIEMAILNARLATTGQVLPVEQAAALNSVVDGA
jgi:hypothetical protein